MVSYWKQSLWSSGVAGTYQQANKINQLFPNNSNPRHWQGFTFGDWWSDPKEIPARRTSICLLQVTRAKWRAIAVRLTCGEADTGLRPDCSHALEDSLVRGFANHPGRPSGSDSESFFPQSGTTVSNASHKPPNYLLIYSCNACLEFSNKLATHSDFAHSHVDDLDAHQWSRLRYSWTA